MRMCSYGIPGVRAFHLIYIYIIQQCSPNLLNISSNSSYEYYSLSYYSNFAVHRLPNCIQYLRTNGIRVAQLLNECGLHCWQWQSI